MKYQLNHWATTSLLVLSAAACSQRNDTVKEPGIEKVISGKSCKGCDIRPGADGFDLRGLDLSRLDYTNTTFSGLDLSGVDFSGATLRGAKFVGTDLTDANFAGAEV